MKPFNVNGKTKFKCTPRTSIKLSIRFSPPHTSVIVFFHGRSSASGAYLSFLPSSTPSSLSLSSILSLLSSLCPSLLIASPPPSLVPDENVVCRCAGVQVCRCAGVQVCSIKQVCHTLPWQQMLVRSPSSSSYPFPPP